jgi:hypothetical protein
MILAQAELTFNGPRTSGIRASILTQVLNGRYWGVASKN